jgi:hypothetical protein
MSVNWTAIGAGAVVVASVVVAGAALSGTYLLYRRYVVGPPPALRRERIRAYSAIMAEVIALNRLAIELSEDDKFQVELERYTLDQESEFTEPVKDLTELLQRNYHVIDGDVGEAVDEYLDFLSTYPTRRVHVGELLTRSSDVVSVMRADLGLPSVFPDADPTDGQAAEPLDDEGVSDVDSEGQSSAE